MIKCFQPVNQDRLSDLPHVGEKIEQRLKERGLPTFMSVAMAGVDAIKAVPGVKDHRATRIWAAAVERAFGCDSRDKVDDLCEVGSPFTEAESADMARVGVHTFRDMSKMHVSQLVEITGVDMVEAASAINQAKVLFGKQSATLAVGFDEKVKAEKVEAEKK